MMAATSSSVSRRRAVSTGVAILLLGANVPAIASGFVEGDLYLVSASLPDIRGAGLPDIGGGIFKINSLTGGKTVFYDAPGTVKGSATYDPYRDRLIFIDGGVADGTVFAVSATGSATYLASAQSNVAARGDGIIYMYRNGYPEGFRYLDSNNVLHDLLNAEGTARFSFGSRYRLEIIYEPVTNSLICAFGGTLGPCNYNNLTCIVKVPLTPDGGQVAAPLTYTAVDVSSSYERTVNLSLMPDGRVFLAVDTNSNGQEPRMQAITVNPTNLVASVFARNGAYRGAAATNAGVFSWVRNQAIILDTLNNELRAYSQGQSGVGSLIATGVSASGSNEAAYLVEIHIPAPTTASISGRILADCPDPGMPLEGIMVDLFDSAGNLLADASTSQDGSFVLEEYPVGEWYRIAAIAPLGYEAPSSMDFELEGSMPLPDMTLQCATPSFDVRETGFWKHNVGKYVRGKTNGTQVTAEELGVWGGEIYAHFFGSDVNPIEIEGVTFVVGGDDITDLSPSDRSSGSLRAWTMEGSAWRSRNDTPLSRSSRSYEKPTSS